MSTPHIYSTLRDSRVLPRVRAAVTSGWENYSHRERVLLLSLHRSLPLSFARLSVLRGLREPKRFQWVRQEREIQTRVRKGEREDSVDTAQKSRGTRWAPISLYAFAIPAPSWVDERLYESMARAKKKEIRKTSQHHKYVGVSRLKCSSMQLTLSHLSRAIALNFFFFFWLSLTLYNLLNFVFASVQNPLCYQRTLIASTPGYFTIRGRWKSQT